MSQKIKNPQEKGNGFLIGIIAVIAVVVVVIGAVVYIGRNQPIGDLPNDEVNFAVSVENNVVRRPAPMPAMPPSPRSTRTSTAPTVPSSL